MDANIQRVVLRADVDEVAAKDEDVALAITRAGAAVTKSRHELKMTFKTRPSTYRLSLAPTGRAHCRGCKRRVGKGELLVTTTACVRPGRSRCLVRCCECIDAKSGSTGVCSSGCAIATRRATHGGLIGRGGL